MKRSNIAIIAACLAALIILSIGAVCILILSGIVIPNSRAAGKYEVKGVDVSHYQGDIDWKTLSDEDISFVFIKATEGSSYVEPNYEKNLAGAIDTELYVGAYHFFSFDSPGLNQAENFISSSHYTQNMLPPVIDLEPYGKYKVKMPTKEDVKPELDDLIEALREHCGKDPIIYTTEKAYKLYLADEYEDCDIWIRSVYKKPSLGGRTWTFWQYSDRGRLKGYSGEEKFIDLNVFCGTKDDFLAY